MVWINLTKNERKMIKLLLENGRVSDTEVATKLSITKPAVGKIRKKLESLGVIAGYSTNIDYGLLGINTFVLSLSKVYIEVIDEYGELAVEEMLRKDPHVINLYRIPEGDVTHAVLYGFKGMDDLERYFNSTSRKGRASALLQNKVFHVFSHNSILKSDSKGIFGKLLDESGTSVLTRKGIQEVEKFKRSLKGLK